MTDTELNKAFERVENLVKELEKSGKANFLWEEYDAGKHVDPKETKFTRELDKVVTEGVPSSTTETDEADEHTEKDLEESYPLTDVSSVGEGEQKVEVRGDESGEEAEKASGLSDRELFLRYAKITKDLLGNIKKADFNKQVMAIASLVSQAQIDADMLIGYALVKKAEEEAEKEETEKAEEEGNAETPPEVPTGEDASVEAELEGKVEEILDDLSNEVAEKMDQGVNPELAVTETLVEKVIGPEAVDVVDELADKAVEMTEAGVPVDQAIVSTLIEETLGPEATKAVEALAEETANKMEEGESVEEALEETLAENVDKGEGEEPKIDEDTRIANELDNAMNEMGVTPESMEEAGKGKPEVKQAAQLVRNFRNDKRYKVIKANCPPDPGLRARFKSYLYELLT